MDFHAFMYVTIGRRRELERGMAGKDPVLGTRGRWPFGQGRPPLLIGDVDTVTRMIEDAARHVPFREVYLLVGQGILARDKCLKSLELFAEKVIPRFR